MLSITGVSHTYANRNKNKRLKALQNINLAVNEGEFLCLLGPSGSGKSTMLDIISGFIIPTEGKVILDSHPVRRPGPERGVVFQEPNLFPWLTVLENVAFGLTCQGAPKERSYRIAADMLELVGLPEFSQFWPHELSGGMKQRVAIARVLATDPRVLLMDEPFSALDAQTRHKLQDELLAIWQVKRKTIIFVTHNVEEAVYLADRIILFCSQPGQITAQIGVDLARPREINSTGFQLYKSGITGSLDVQEELA